MSFAQRLSPSVARRTITFLAIVWIIACAALLLPQTQNILLSFVENTIRHRPIKFIGMWQVYLLSTAWSGIFVAAALLFCLYYRFVIPVTAEQKTRIVTALQIVLAVSCLDTMLLLAAASDAIWNDEAWSLALIRHPTLQLIGFLQTTDVHTPLYFLILKLASLLFGDSVLTMKLVSVVPSIATLLIVSLFLKKHVSDRATILWLLSFPASLSILHYSIEIRMYSWAFFFITMAALCAWHIVFAAKPLRYWLAFLVCAVGAAYTHYYAAVLAAIGYLMLLFYILCYDRRQLGWALATAVGGVLLYSPWLFAALSAATRVANGYWVEASFPRDFLAIYGRFIFDSGNMLLLALLWFAVLAYFFIKRKPKEEWFAFAALCCLTIFLAIGIVVGLLIGPVLNDHHLFPACGLVWLFFAIIASTIVSKRVFVFICLTLFILGITTVTVSLYMERKEQRDFTVSYNYISTRLKPGDFFFFDGDGDHLSNVFTELFPGHVTLSDSEPPIGSGLTNSYHKLFKRTVLPTTALFDGTVTGKGGIWFVIGKKEELTPSFLAVLAGSGEGLKFDGAFGWNIDAFDLYHVSDAADLTTPAVEP